MSVFPLGWLVWLPLLPLSAATTLVYDWRNRITGTDRFSWRHWRAVPILSAATLLLGVLFSFFPPQAGTFGELTLRQVVAMLVAFAVIHAAWLVKQAQQRT
jgi:protein-S-isoprenylcysteine O-methyltransferase Ste14